MSAPRYYDCVICHSPVVAYGLHETGDAELCDSKSCLEKWCAQNSTPIPAPWAVYLSRRIADWPQVWREQYEERAALMEFSGNFSRADAERLAEQDIRKVAAQDGGERRTA